MTIQRLSRRYSRRSFIKVGSFGVAATALLAACGDDDDDGAEEPQMAATMSPTMEPGEASNGANAGDGANELSLISGWYRGRAVRYYDFGMNTPLTEGSSIATAPIYAMIRGMDAEGNPQLVEGQGNIIAVGPGDQGYSDLWQVMLVTVPEDYEANQITSASDVMSSGYGVTETDMYVNCPVVPEGTTLEGGEPLVQGWLDGSEVFYPDFGPNPAVAIPIWAMITGMDAEGNPQFVEGQQNIIDSVPEDEGYSAFWRVNLVTVPEDFEPNSLKAADDVRSSGYDVMETDLVVNCPVTFVA